MNDFVQKLMHKYNYIGNNKNIRVLQESQQLLADVRQDFKSNGNLLEFHQKFLLFIESFSRSSGSISEIYSHLRSYGDVWVRLSDNIKISFEKSSHLSQFADLNDFFVVDENFKGLDILTHRSFRTQKNIALLFQLFGFCDYLVVFNQGNVKAQSAVSLLQNIVNQLKNINQEYLSIKQNTQKINKLEMELLSMQRDLISTERNLKRRVYEIHNVLEISNELYSILNLKQLINSALLIIVGQVGCQKAFAFLYDTNQRKYSKRFTKGLDQIELADMEIQVDHPLVSYFQNINKPVLVSELKKQAGLQPVCETFLTHQIELIAPIVYGDRVQGFIGCGALLSDQGFTKDEMDLFNILVNIISISVSNAQTYEEVKNLSLTDAMTNLNNYRYFEDRLKEEINRARRNDSPVSLIMLDIDHFKNYNDTLGHQAGDEALRNLGWILKNTVREEDIVNRYGGEEFCIILPGIEKNVISVLGERIRAKVEEYPFYKENVQPGGRITISLGGSCFSCDADNFEDLVYKADQALYKSKNSGRNCLTVYSADM